MTRLGHRTIDKVIDLGNGRSGRTKQISGSDIWQNLASMHLKLFNGRRAALKPHAHDRRRQMNKWTSVKIAEPHDNLDVSQ